MSWKKLFEPNWKKLITFFVLLGIIEFIFIESLMALTDFVTIGISQLDVLHIFLLALYAVLNPFSFINSSYLLLSGLAEHFLYFLNYIWDYFLACLIVKIIDRTSKKS